MSTKKKINFKSVGNRIRIKREEKGLTQKQAARIVNMKEGYWSNIEKNNISSIGLKALVLISNALDTNIDYFLVDSLKDNEYITYKEINNTLNKMSDKNKKLAIDLINDVYNNSEIFETVEED